MIKFKFDTSELNGTSIASDLDKTFKAAFATAVSEASREAMSYAEGKLKRRLKAFKDGYRVHRIDDSRYVVSVTGTFANWGEQGIQVGEISKLIMQGNRADHNKGEGKNYVDVPLTKDADSMGSVTFSGKKGSSVNVKAFKNADELMKGAMTEFKASNRKHGGITKEKAYNQRIQDIIKSVNPKSGATSFLTIRRVTDKSVWPKTPVSGADALGHLGKFIDENIDSILERFL